jgi:hypothetical protein
MKNWMKNPVTLKGRSDLGRIQAGMRTPEMNAAMMMARRRPTN